MTGKTIGVAIVGGSGYGAGELLRLLASHPAAEVASVVSQSHPGQPIAALHPQLAAFHSLTLSPALNLEQLASYPASVVFSALPHGASARMIDELTRSGTPDTLRIIDLSGDYRLSDPALHARFYPETGATPLRGRFCYGLPELNRGSIAAAKLIANPGCYATACILAVAPLIGRYRGAVFFDAKSGSSGAGRAATAETHHPYLHANVAAYKIFSHRHEPEIQQVLGADLECSFVPQLIPVARGIYVTAHLQFEKEVDAQSLYADYMRCFAAARFVRLRQEPPALANVVCSNFCDISIAVRGRRAVAIAALDNLVKGMAGQAIQNMNLMCGLPEDTGLHFPPPGLV